ncbi:MAG: uracil-DNA glycosylase [Clostridia bacterium]|nr:uracil-DNA glycosylase [Clostridia bacterium]
MEQELLKLEKACRACQRCPLGATRTNLVFGVGVPGARILFVGEGPGEQEDLRGEPFVGRSGQLLDKYLSLIDLDRRKNIYIANMVKCRPPHNRDPKPEETEQCLPWLRSQVRILRPQLIVCLGRIAAQRLISPDFRVTRQHGQLIRKGNFTLMGTFHPAALLRNEAQKADALSDFQVIRRWMQENDVH